MSRFRLTRAAAADLDEIWSHTARTWGEAQAETYVSEVFDCFARASDAPRMGQDRSAFLEGARSLRTGRHLIFYREMAEGIVILRVIHERRNWAALEFSEKMGDLDNE